MTGIRSLKKARGLFYKMCEEYELPEIPVYRLGRDDPKLGYFESIPFRVGLRLPVSKDTIRHEFCHYIVCLSGNAQKAEEDLVDYSVNL